MQLGFLGLQQLAVGIPHEKHQPDWPSEKLNILDTMHFKFGSLGLLFS